MITTANETFEIGAGVLVMLVLVLFNRLSGADVHVGT